VNVPEGGTPAGAGLPSTSARRRRARRPWSSRPRRAPRLVFLLW